MKKSVLVIILIFLLLSIAVTVYLVVTQKLELRKKAAPTPYQVNYCTASTYPDKCSGGPYVAIEQVGAPSYDPASNIQTFKLRAKRVNPTVNATQGPTVTPHEFQCASRADCEPKAAVCKEVSACMNQQCIFIDRPDGFTCIGGKCQGGVCVPNPTATSPLVATNTPVPTTVPASFNASIAPSPTNTPVPGQALGASINATINVLVVGYTCSNATVGQCSNCGPEDAPNYVRKEEWLEIPAGSSLSNEFNLNVTRYGDAVCGCVQMDLYIVDVKVNDISVGCPARGNATSGYLCATGNGGDCTAGSTNTPIPPTSTPILRVSETPIPTVPPEGPTSTPTLTPTPTTVQVVQGPTLTPTVSSPTRTPTSTPTPTKVVSASATVALPEIPESGGILPTLVIGIVGVLVLAFGLLFAL